MPKCGNHVVNCDLPVFLDSYSGCGYDCAYCNEHIKGRGLGEIRAGEGPRTLKGFTEGKRTVTSSWCDWPIPIHFGVLSDPFQPCEAERRRSWALLRVFAESGYPVIISTKNPAMLLEDDYRCLLRHCNLALQVSMTVPAYDVWDCHAPSFRDRYMTLYPLSRYVKRLLIRAQPYTLEVKDDLISFLSYYSGVGIYGIMLEGLKSNKGTAELTEHFGSSMVYPLDELIPHFEEIRDACHDMGLKFYAAENRLRHMGDSLTCCGVDGLKGFRPNVANLNHDPIVYTDRMREVGTAQVFRSKRRTKETADRYSQMSYAEAMAERLPVGLARNATPTVPDSISF